MPLVALNLKFRVLRRVNAFLMAKIEIFVVFNSKVIRERERRLFSYSKEIRGSGFWFSNFKKYSVYIFLTSCFIAIGIFLFGFFFKIKNYFS